MFLKKSLTILKEKFYGIFLIELIFLFSTFFFLVFAKNKLATYVMQLQALSTQAAALQQGTDQAQLAVFLDNFQGMANNAVIFANIIIPVVIMGIWAITQTGFWFVLKQQKVKRWKAFFGKALAGHAIIFVIVYALLFFIPVQFSMFDTMDTSIMKWIVGVILLLLLMTFLAVLEDQPFAKAIKITGQKLKKTHSFLLPFFLFIVVFLVLVYLFLTLFTTYMEGAVIIASIIPLTLYLLVVMLLTIWLKIIFFIKVQGA
ncbi:hypothetical protein HYS50_02465 [Candidatus Woesearchaeota archaeon]|nr:hypothetical protein [Candidatus Woesearchaeota archaeon]